MSRLNVKATDAALILHKDGTYSLRLPNQAENEPIQPNTFLITCIAFLVSGDTPRLRGLRRELEQIVHRQLLAAASGENKNVTPDNPQ